MGAVLIDRNEIEQRMSQEEANRKSLATFVTMKRLEQANGHFQAAIAFLNPPDTNTKGAAERDVAADMAAHEFIAEFFKLAKVNVVDLSAAGTAEVFEHQTRLEFAAQAQQPPPGR